MQVRQQPDEGEMYVTFATAVAANVDGDRVGVYAREPFFLRVDGTAVNGAMFRGHLAHGGTVARNGSSVTVTWPDGSKLAITLLEDFTGPNLSYNFTPAPGTAPTLTGLLGTDNTSTQLMGSDGTALPLSDPKFETKLYSQFANSWRINQAESLFDYRSGESTATFTNLRIPYSDYTVASLSASERARAEAICTALGVRSEPLLDDCILDVGVTGDPAFAAAEAQVAAAGAPTTSPSSAVSFGEASNVSFAGHSGTVLKGASCPTGPTCVAVGQDMGNYAGANGTIVVSETTTGWRTAPAPLPSPPPTHGADSLSSVSCPAAGTCTAVGGYQSTNKATSPLVETGTGSAWQPASTVAVPVANGTGAVLNGVSCTKAGTCLAVGTYSDSALTTHAMAVLSTGGQWGQGAKAVEVELPPGPGGSPVLNAVSCAGTGCLAVGEYGQSFYVRPGMAVAESGGQFQRAVVVRPPASSPGFVQTTLTGVVLHRPGHLCRLGQLLEPQNRRRLGHGGERRRRGLATFGVYRAAGGHQLYVERGVMRLCRQLRGRGLLCR